MAVFRNNQARMGFRQLTVYVQDGDREKLHLEADRLKAEYFMTLLAQPSTNEAKIAMAQCNYKSVPDVSKAHLLWHQSEDREIKRLCKKVIDHLEEFSTARRMLERTVLESDEAMVNTAAISVANNYMAAYLWLLTQEELRAKRLSPLGGTQEDEE